VRWFVLGSATEFVFRFRGNDLHRPDADHVESSFPALRRIAAAADYFSTQLEAIGEIFR
jgi:hypothetical protein